MTDDTPPTELTERLQALGRHPVDPATASQHLSAMAGASLGRTGLRQKLQVAGALLAGIFIGGTGLATAGALGDSAEHRADKIVAVVTGKSDKADKADKVEKADKADKSKADRDAEDELIDAEKTDGGSKCPAGENHGQAVRTAAHAPGATGASVSEVARDKTACAAKPGTADADAGADAAEKADKADKASQNGGQSSGQGGTKASDAQERAEDARTARSDNSGTPADVSEDSDSDADGAGRTPGSGKRTGGSARPDVGDDD